MERGELVDDALICQVMGARLGEPDAAGGFILDGFPRTAPQAGALDALLGRLGLGLTGALLLDVGDEQVVERLSGRRTCPACGRVYHTAFNPPRRDGRCDHDGTPLAQRDDDRPAIIGNRPSRLPPPERAAGRPLPRRRAAGGDRRLGHPELVAEHLAAALERLAS
jgi:adenylate kinase